MSQPRPKSYAECFDCILENGIGLSYVPENMRSYEMCWAAIMSFPLALEAVPDRFKTPELCLVATRRDSEAMAFVPGYFCSPDGKLLDLDIMQKEHEKLFPDHETAGGVNDKTQGEGPNHYQILRDAVFSRSQITEKMCRDAVIQDGLAIDLVPDNMRTEELCFLAVRQNRQALAFVPDELKSPALCLEAVMVRELPDLDHVMDRQIVDYCPDCFRCIDGSSLKSLEEMEKDWLKQKAGQ